MAKQEGQPEYINPEGFAEVFRGDKNQRKFAMSVDLIRDMGYAHHLAWRESQAVLAHVLRDYTGEVFDHELAERLFVTAREACRLATQSGHVGLHLKNYKARKGQLFMGLPIEEIPKYTDLAVLYETELIDGVLTTVSTRRLL